MTVSPKLMACAGWAAMLLILPPASGKVAIVYMDGKVQIGGHPATIERGKKVTNLPLIANGQIMETSGRVQTWYDIFVSKNSSLRMLSDRRAELAFELRSGSAIVRMSDMKAGAITVLCKDATIVLKTNGEYRIDADVGRVQVYDGKATVTRGVALRCDQSGECLRTVEHSPITSVDLRKGQQAGLSEGLPVSAFDTKHNGAFRRWVTRRFLAERPRASPEPPPFAQAADGSPPVFATLPQ
jgi:hypothetical protein